MNVRARFVKIECTLQAKVLKQPIFNNPLVINVIRHPLGVNRFSEGRAIVKAGCTKIKDLWDREDREWKSLLALGINSHVINRTSRDIIICSIPWNLATFPSWFQIGDLINKAVGYLAPLTWIYRVTRVLSNLVKAIEFHRISPIDLIKTMSFQEVTISFEG